MLSWSGGVTDRVEEDGLEDYLDLKYEGSHVRYNQLGTCCGNIIVMWKAKWD